MADNETALVVQERRGLINSSRVLAVRQGEAGSADYVPHLNLEQVKELAKTAGRLGEGHYSDRNELLVLTIFDGCLRCSEAIGLRIRDIARDGDGWVLRMLGKGRRAGVAAICPTLAARLQAYAFREKLTLDDKLFPFNRPRAYQIISAAYDACEGLYKPSKEKDRVGCVHVLRHSGAIERLRASRDPAAIQHQLRHRSAVMTLRYFKTIQADESLEVMKKIEFGF